MLAIRRTLVHLLVVAVAAAPSWAGEASAPPQLSAKTATRSAARPSRAQALRFAESVAASLNAGDGAPMESTLDLDEMLRRAMVGREMPEDFRKGFIEGARTSMTIGREIAAQVASGGSYTLLHVDDDGTKATFRLLGPNGAGINYHEIHLVASGPDVRIADIHVAALGEHLSDLFRRMVTLVLAGLEDRTLLQKVLDLPSEDLAALPRAVGIVDLVRAGRAAEAVAVYEALPSGLRSDKSFAAQALIAAVTVGGETARRVIERHARLFPDDPALDLMQIDHLIATQRWNEAMASIDRLHARYDDPYLHVMQARILTMAGRAAGARALLEATAQAHPELHDAWWELVALSLLRDDHAETARLLGRLEALGVEIADLATVPEYATFVGTPQHRAWLERSKTP